MLPVIAARARPSDGGRLGRAPAEGQNQLGFALDLINLERNTGAMDI